MRVWFEFWKLKGEDFELDEEKKKRESKAVIFFFLCFCSVFFVCFSCFCFGTHTVLLLVVLFFIGSSLSAQREGLLRSLHCVCREMEQKLYL